MKFSKKRNQYEASNVSFNPETVQAYSYKWWKFLGTVNGKIVFNNANYSNTTNRHQSKVRALMAQKGISAQLTLRFTRESLSEKALRNEIGLTRLAINEGEKILVNPRRKKSLDAPRQDVIECLKEHIKQVEIVLYGTELNASLN